MFKSIVRRSAERRYALCCLGALLFKSAAGRRCHSKIRHSRFSSQKGLDKN